ncbi:MAG: transporter substrate-binding domain-containing protein [Clostridiales bacterium]|nr:transporter substrate-binding domain-containing protein [Clostridiales bacterium]
MKNTNYGMIFLMGILLLTGCSSSNQEEEPQTESADVIIGVENDNAPCYFTDESGEPAGFYVKLMDALQKEEDFTYEFVSLSAAEYMADDASCDLYLGTIETEVGDLTDYVQSDIICETKLCLVVIKGSGVEDTDDLLDASISARAGTGEESFARYLSSEYDGESIVFQRVTDVVEDLTKGYSQAAVIDAANFSSLKQTESTLKKLKESEKYFSVHCFTASQERGIPDVIADGLAEIQSDGTLAALIQEYGFE